MKLIFEKQAYQMAEMLTKQLSVLFKQSGKKLSVALEMQFQYRTYISLGGKKKNYNKYVND
jgi:hypothetical protein